MTVRSAARTYYVSHADATDVEPGPGWFVAYDDADGETEIAGPFSWQHEAEMFRDNLPDAWPAEQEVP